MIVQVRERYISTFIKQFDIDIEDYKDWLDGENPTEDNLLDYIQEAELDPSNAWNDKNQCIDSYIEDDMNEIFKALNNG